MFWLHTTPDFRSQQSQRNQRSRRPRSAPNSRPGRPFATAEGAAYSPQSLTSGDGRIEWFTTKRAPEPEPPPLLGPQDYLQQTQLPEQAQRRPSASRPSSAQRERDGPRAQQQSQGQADELERLRNFQRGLRQCKLLDGPDPAAQGRKALLPLKPPQPRRTKQQQEEITERLLGGLPTSGGLPRWCQMPEAIGPRLMPSNPEDHRVEAEQQQPFETFSVLKAQAEQAVTRTRQLGVRTLPTTFEDSAEDTAGSSERAPATSCSAPGPESPVIGTSSCPLEAVLEAALEGRTPVHVVLPQQPGGAPDLPPELAREILELALRGRLPVRAISAVPGNEGKKAAVPDPISTACTGRSSETDLCSEDQIGCSSIGSSSEEELIEASNQAKVTCAEAALRSRDGTRARR